MSLIQVHYSKCSVNEEKEKEKEKIDNDDDEGGSRGRKERKGPAYTTQKLHIKEINLKRTHDIELTSGTSSRIKVPSLPALNKVRNFFDIIRRAWEAT